MVWWITLGGFALGCVIAYVMTQQGSGKDEDS